MKILDYTEASEFYLKALLLNPNDKAVQARRLDVENMYTMDCNRYSGLPSLILMTVITRKR